MFARVILAGGSGSIPVVNEEIPGRVTLTVKLNIIIRDMVGGGSGTGTCTRYLVRCINNKCSLRFRWIDTCAGDPFQRSHKAIVVNYSVLCVGNNKQQRERQI